ncbi:MAG: hypothetical protein K1X95_10430 [Acidimicrobiia bacterium]|nr:hypothetical protein [Acidimicrobiia bacterium]
MGRFRCALVGALTCAALVVAAVPARGADPVPGTLAWAQRELQAVADGFGRTREQSADPAYRFAVSAEMRRLQAFWRAEDEAEFRGRPRITLTRLVTGPNVGDPWRNETTWGGTHQRLYFLNEWGAKLTADLWGPADLFDSDAEHPGVVITDGSIQGNSRMYWWAAQTLADAGYIVMSYDVQGQGESETFGHHPDGSVWCGRVDQPDDTPPLLVERGPCPGVPFQQSSVFMGGAVGAHNFFLSTPDAPWEHFQDGTGTAAYNPWWDRVDRGRVGAAGHSFGAAAVSFAQGNPQLLREPIRAIVAWDRLSACQAAVRSGEACPADGLVPVNAPALDLVAEDVLFPTIRTRPPDPDSKLGAFGHWRDAGVDVMALTLRASTHLEFTSVPFLPASAHGQDIARHYTLAWFDRYLRDDPSAAARLFTRDLHVDHYTPTGAVVPLELAPADYLSFRYRSGVATSDMCSRDWVADTAC